METSQTTLSKPSFPQKRKPSPEVKDLESVIGKLGGKLIKAQLNAKDRGRALSERKAEAVCALESVFETGMVSFIKDLVNIMKRIRNEPQTSSAVEVVEQTKQDVEEISESASETESGSTKKPKRKKKSPEFRSLWSAATNLVALLYRLHYKVKTARVGKQEGKQMIEHVMKLMHTAKIFETIQKLQTTLKEITRIENANRSEPQQSPNPPTAENHHESTSESIGYYDDLFEDIRLLSPCYFDEIHELEPQSENKH